MTMPPAGRSAKELASAKFERCLQKVRRKGGAGNPYAICVKSTGESPRKKH